MIIVTTIVVEMCFGGGFGGFGESVSEALHLEAMFFSKHVTLRLESSVRF